jgi:hypothetical protein
MKKNLDKSTMKLILISFLLLFITQSCWVPCAPAINGTVKDKISGNLIDSVQVLVYEGSELTMSVYSDSLGRFDASARSKSNFMFHPCERGVNLIFIKDGYLQKSITENAPAMDLEISLEK